MQNDQDKNHGKKIEPHASWRGPMQVERVSTDVFYVKSLIFCLLVWIIVGLYVSPNWPRSLGSYTFKDLLLPSLVTLSSIDLAGVLSAYYIIGLRYCPKFTVIGCIVLICVKLPILTGQLVVRYVKNEGSRRDLEFSIFLCVISFTIIVIAVVTLRRKAIIAIKVIREVGRAAIFFPSMLVLAGIQFMIQLLLFGFAGYVYICIFNVDKWSLLSYFLLFVNTLGLYWSARFINAFVYMTVSGTCAASYWTLNERFFPCYTLARTACTITRYHTGTLAFGSLILGICRIIRQFIGTSKGVPSCADCYCSSHFGNLKRLLSCPNRKAYIMTIAHGKDFLQSSKDASNLLMRNTAGVLVTPQITRGITYLGAFIILSTTFWGSCLVLEELRMHSRMHLHVDDALFITMVFFGFLGSVSIMNCYFSIFDVAVNTIYLCVLEDHERNDGSEHRPSYMSDKLKTLILG